MKQILYTLLLFGICSINVRATVLTVDNNPNSAAQFTGLQTAITNANAGDTIYISGSTANYGSISIKVKLTLIGAGYNPIKQSPYATNLTDITLDTLNSISGASGTYIAGITINSIVCNYGANNITVERIRFNANFLCNSSSSGCIVRNNFFLNGTVNINYTSNIIVENNILRNATVSNSNQSSVIIRNNVFLHGIGSGANCLVTVSNASIINNIFWGTSPLGSGVSNNTFNNNLTFQTADDNIPGGSNNGTGNLVAMNPLFINVPTPDIDYGYDYGVTNVSPASNAGTDGLDLGVYGGTAPLPDNSGMPGIPQMIEMNINNPVVQPAGNLNVDFKARKNN